MSCILGAVGILVTYAVVLENHWPEWWHFFLGFAVAAAASLAFANLLSRDAEAGKDDPALLKAGHILVLVQLAGVAVALVSMFVDGKFPRAVTYADWAACNIFFFGALAIAAISAHALLTNRNG